MEDHVRGMKFLSERPCIDVSHCGGINGALWMFAVGNMEQEQQEVSLNSISSGFFQVFFRYRG